MDDVEAWRRFEAAPVARLATRNPNGAVDLVPITFAVLPDRTIVSAVDHKPKRTRQLQRLANIDADPSVTVLADHYADDWSELWWVRVRARATVVGAGAPEHGPAIAALVEKYEQYRQHRPAGPVICMTPIHLLGWGTFP